MSIIAIYFKKGGRILYIASLENIAEVLEILSARMCEYLADDLSLEFEDSLIRPTKIDSFKLESYTALINLKSDMNGTIGLSVSTSLAKFMVSQFIFGEVTDEEIEEMAGESVAEILNVVLGNVIKDFPITKEGGKVGISTPYIMHKTSHISKSDGGLMVVSKFNTNHGELILTFFS